eukprot:1980256-Pyramimonas_sp.AAC.1
MFSGLPKGSGTRKSSPSPTIRFMGDIQFYVLTGLPVPVDVTQFSLRRVSLVAAIGQAAGQCRVECRWWASRGAAECD